MLSCEQIRPLSDTPPMPPSLPLGAFAVVALVVREVYCKCRNDYQDSGLLLRNLT